MKVSALIPVKGFRNAKQRLSLLLDAAVDSLPVDDVPEEAFPVDRTALIAGVQEAHKLAQVDRQRIAARVEHGGEPARNAFVLTTVLPLAYAA